MTTPGLWQSGADYESYVGRWSRRVADVFVERLAAAIGTGRRWLDVGCGTGAVTETILARGDPASVLGIDPSTAFITFAREHVVDPRAAFAVADAASVPLADGAVDASVSGLVLNFVPDPVAMVAEMRRVTRPDGVVALYVWDYAGRMELMRHFWDAAIEQDPAVAATSESLRFTICAPDPLRDVFAEAGLRDIAVEPIDVPTVFRDFDDYWQPFLQAAAPAPRHAQALSDVDREDLRARIQARLPIEDDGSIPLIARAWAVRASV